MAAFAAGVLDVMDATGIPRAVLIGNSMGGRIAVEMAFAAPERVEALVLVAPAGLTPPPGWLKAVPKFRVPYESSLRDLALAQMFARPLDAPRTEPLAEAEREALQDVGLAEFVKGSARCLAEMARSVPPEARLGPLPLKGLVWGREDRYVLPEVAGILQGIWPKARLEMIGDAGHVPHLERPEAFAEALKKILAESGTSDS